MKAKKLWIVFAGLLLLLLGLSLTLLLFARSVKADPTPHVASLISAAKEAEVKTALAGAPWQGLRYLKDQNTWRFYGFTGETQKIELIHPIDLIKVYYLGAQGGVAFTWAATEIHFPRQQDYTLTNGKVHSGQLVAVDLSGEFVDERGVDWAKCDLEYCHYAELVDTMIVLDDQGTGLSNGFIRYGWGLPSYPFYGFLCWEITPSNQVAILQEVR